jgi:hypothetical protein
MAHNFVAISEYMVDDDAIVLSECDTGEGKKYALTIVDTDADEPASMVLAKDQLIECLQRLLDRVRNVS